MRYALALVMLFETIIVFIPNPSDGVVFGPVVIITAPQPMKVSE